MSILNNILRYKQKHISGKTVDIILKTKYATNNSITLDLFFDIIAIELFFSKITHTHIKVIY